MGYDDLGAFRRRCCCFPSSILPTEKYLDVNHGINKGEPA